MTGTPHLYNITLMVNRAAETRRLTSNSHAGAIREVIEAIARKHADLYAWVLMPDHIHLLFGRDHALDDVDTFAGRVKRRINKAFEARGMHKVRWRDGCVKHPVSLETLRAMRDYILANPVRGRLVDKAADWPHGGTPAELPPGAQA